MAEITSSELDKILARLQDRREFLALFGKGLGYGALATVLPACGGGQVISTWPPGLILESTRIFKSPPTCAVS